MRTISIKSFADFESNTISKNLKIFSYVKTGRTFLIAIDGPITFIHTLSRQDQEKYETTLQGLANKQIGDEHTTPNPFASKTLNGKSIYRRKLGIVKDCPTGETEFEFVVPYNNVKINEVEFVNCEAGDCIDLFVHDTEQGHVQLSKGVPPESITPFLILNQFGFDTAVPNGFYRDVSEYDADLIKGMKVRVVYKHAGQDTLKNGMNIVFHELK